MGYSLYRRDRPMTITYLTGDATRYLRDREVYIYDLPAKG